MILRNHAKLVSSPQNLHRKSSYSLINSMVLPPVNFLLIYFRVIIRLHIFVVAFTCNAKTLCNCHSFFLFSLFLAQVLDGVSLAWKRVTKIWPIPWTQKNNSIKIVPQVIIHEACGTWHGLFTVISNHSIQKSIKNGQKIENKLASYLVHDRRFKDQTKEKSSW